MHKKDWMLLILFTVLLIAVRLPSLDEPLDNDSGANAFLARQILRGDTLYDKFHPAHHVPGIYYTFVIAFRLFGDHPNSPRLLLFAVTLACAWLLYRMGCLFFDRRTGILAAIFFILVSSQRFLAGQTVEMEHFANLPLIGALFLALVLLRKRETSWQWIGVGVLGAVSMLYKVTFVAPLVVAGILILIAAYRTWNEAGALKTMLLRWMWLGLGALIPLVIVAAYFASVGLWDRFQLAFEFGVRYLNDPLLMSAWMLPRPFGFPMYWMSVNNIALLFLGLVGTYRLLRRSIPLREMDRLADLGLALWFVVSFALAGLRGGGFPYYLLPVVPPLAIVASIEINLAYQQWKLLSEKNANLARMASIGLVVGLFVWANYSIYHDYARYKLARISYDDFLENAYIDGFASHKVAEYLRSHTTKDDFIYVWSNRVEVYYYADRLPPIDILWPSYVDATGSPQRVFDTKTKYIVVDESENLGYPEWLRDGLAADYELEITIEGRQVYRRRS